MLGGGIKMFGGGLKCLDLHCKLLILLLITELFIAKEWFLTMLHWYLQEKLVRENLSLTLCVVRLTVHDH